MKCFAVFLVISIFLNTPAFADLRDNLNEFRLLSNCQSMYLLVGVQKHETKIGLTDNSIQNLVESRLRSARLYTDDILANSYLDVQIVLVDRAFRVDVDFNKEVVDSITRHKFPATTWNTNTTGIASNSDYVLSSLSQLVDKFLTQFLRVNEKACKN